MSDAPDVILHALRRGVALCGLPGIPGAWPPGHRWVRSVAAATCNGCKLIAIDAPPVRSVLSAYRVVVDQEDKCDSCGLHGRGRLAVSFGAGKPVICAVCITAARAALGDFRKVVIDGEDRPP